MIKHVRDSRLQKPDIGNDIPTQKGVGFHDLKLLRGEGARFVQNGIENANLVYVVQRGRHLDLFQFFLIPAQIPRYESDGPLVTEIDGSFPISPLYRPLPKSSPSPGFFSLGVRLFYDCRTRSSMVKAIPRLGRL